MSVPLAFERPTVDVSVATADLDAGWQPLPERSVALAVVFAAAATVAVVVLVDVVLLLTLGPAA